MIKIDQFRNAEGPILIVQEPGAEVALMALRSRALEMRPKVSTVWFALRDCFCMLLIVWAATITVFAESEVVTRFVWIPVSVGLAGVLGTMFILAIPADVILIAHLATLAVFIISFEVLKKDRVSLLVRINHREG